MNVKYREAFLHQHAAAQFHENKAHWLIALIYYENHV